MRLGCLLPLVSIALLIGGGQGIYTAISNSKPVEIAITDFATAAPDAEWLRVTGGELDTLGAAYTSAFGKGDAKEIYIPVRPPGDEDGPVHLLLLTKDPELLAVVNEGKELDDKDATEAEVMAYLVKNHQRLRPARDIEGLVQFGIDGGGKKERKIRKLFDNLAADAVILEDGKKPSMGQGAGMLLGGFVLGGFPPRRSARKTPPPMPAQPPAPPQNPGPYSGPQPGS